MSAADIIESARKWTGAIAEAEAADAAWHACTNHDQMALYNLASAAHDRLKEAARTHLAAVRDLPHDGIHDDERIVALRNENERLRDQAKKSKRQVAAAMQNNETRNRQLDALHLVWCDGGCGGGVHRYCGSKEDITEELVAEAERNTRRLRSWLVNRTAKLASGRYK